MALLLVGTLYGAALSLLFGWGVERLILRFFQVDRPISATPLSLSILLGMAVLAGLLGVWSFFWGISTRALVAFTAIGIVILFAVRGHAWASLLAAWGRLKTGGPIPVAILAAALVYALYMAAAGSPTYDVGLYHAQAIRWIEYFPVVPGLANLHDRLGFNSSLFLLSALWGFMALQWHVYQIPSLVIVLCVLGYSMSLVSERPVLPKLSMLLAAGVLLYFASRRRLWIWLASPSTDLCAAAIAWTVFLVAANSVEDARQADSSSDLWASACIMVLALFDFTLKASTAPILLLPLFFLLKTRALWTWKKGLALAALAVVVSIPWAARNVVLTGYVLYPFAAVDLFSLDWKLPAGNVQALESNIRTWAISPGLPSDISSLQILMDWLPPWWRSLSGMDPYLVSVAFGMPVLLVVSWLFRRELAAEITRNAALYAFAFTGVIFWFLKAPDTRLGYGFLVPAFLFGAVSIIKAIVTSFRIPSGWLRGTAQALLAFILLLQMAQIPLRSWRHYARARQVYPEVDTVTVNVNDQAVLVPAAGDQCWYAALPCTPGVRPGLALRGVSLGDGFRLRGK